MQIWLIDDAGAAADPEPLHKWFQKLRQRAPRYGYHIKKGKCFLVPKNERAEVVFRKEIEDGALVLAEGIRYLGHLLEQKRTKDSSIRTR